MIDRDEYARIVKRFEIACEYIRARDILRLQLSVGLPVTREAGWHIQQLERRFDELRPTLRNRSVVDFPGWVQ